MIRRCPRCLYRGAVLYGVCVNCSWSEPPAELLDIPERELHKQRLYQTRKRIIEEEGT